MYTKDPPSFVSPNFFLNVSPSLDRKDYRELRL